MRHMGLADVCVCVRVCPPFCSIGTLKDVKVVESLFGFLFMNVGLFLHVFWLFLNVLACCVCCFFSDMYRVLLAQETNKDIDASRRDGGASSGEAAFATAAQQESEAMKSRVHELERVSESTPVAWCSTLGV